MSYSHLSFNINIRNLFGCYCKYCMCRHSMLVIRMLFCTTIVRGIKISHKSVDKSLYLEAEKEADWRKWMEHLQLAAILFKDEENVRKSLVFSDNISMLSTVMEGKPKVAPTLVSQCTWYVSGHSDFIPLPSLSRASHRVIAVGEYSSSLVWCHPTPTPTHHRECARSKRTDFSRGLAGWPAGSLSLN